MSGAKKAPKQGMWKVEFLKDLGSNEKGTTQTYHASTATTLEAKGHIKILSEVKNHKPKTIKDAEK